MEDKSSAVAESGSALHGAPSGSEPSAAFTPGPWRELTSRRNPPTAPDVVQVSSDNGCVAVVFGKTTPQRQSTARLIAAAPDLLEVCRVLIAGFDQMGRVHPLTPTGQAVVDFAKEAIAKAEGCQP